MVKVFRSLFIFIVLLFTCYLILVLFGTLNDFSHFTGNKIINAAQFLQSIISNHLRYQLPLAVFLAILFYTATKPNLVSILVSVVIGFLVLAFVPNVIPENRSYSDHFTQQAESTVFTETKDNTFFKYNDNGSVITISVLSDKHISVFPIEPKISTTVTDTKQPENSDIVTKKYGSFFRFKDDYNLFHDFMEKLRLTGPKNALFSNIVFILFFFSLYGLSNITNWKLFNLLLSVLFLRLFFMYFRLFDIIDTTTNLSAFVFPGIFLFMTIVFTLFGVFRQPKKQKNMDGAL